MEIKCEECRGFFNKSAKHKKYCSDECKVGARKAWWRRYNQIRKTKNPAKSEEYRLSGNNRRKAKRSAHKLSGICTECEEPCLGNISRCEKCNAANNKRSLSYNRSRGMLERGNSSCEQTIFNLVRDLYDGEITVRDNSTIVNPITGRFLELDLLLKELFLAFEIDGPMHRYPVYGSERLEAQVFNDLIKDMVCQELGIRLIRINTEDLIEIDNIRAILSQAIRNDITVV